MNEDVNIEAIALKQWHRKYGLFAFASIPDTKIIMQLLKLSETDKQRAIENLTNLFGQFRKETGISGSFMNADMCKQVVEDYLENHL